MRRNRFLALMLALCMGSNNMSFTVMAEETADPEAEVSAETVPEETEYSEETDEEDISEVSLTEEIPELIPEISEEGPEESTAEETDEPEPAAEETENAEPEPAVEETAEEETAQVFALRDPVSYISRSWDGTQVTEEEMYAEEYALFSEVPLNEENIMVLEGGWYVLDRDLTVGSRIEVTGTVYVILEDGKTLTAPEGIHVSPDYSLTVYGQSGDSGRILCVKAAGQDDGNAAIGGNVYISGSGYNTSYTGERCGEITICGGTVEARRTTAGAAIGAGQKGSLDRLRIYGGTVKAQVTGGGGGPGIGTGLDYSGWSGGAVEIYGGYVEAVGSTYDCDGIGRNDESRGLSRITIRGGTVLSTGGWSGSGTHSMRADEIVLGDDMMVSYGHEQDNPNEPQAVAAVTADNDPRAAMISSNRFSMVRPCTHALMAYESSGQGHTLVQCGCKPAELGVLRPHVFNADEVCEICGYSKYTYVSAWGELKDAFASARNGDVIRLKDEITAGSNDTMLTAGTGKDLILDLNGHTLSRGLSTGKQDGHVIYVQAGAALTIRDSGAQQTGVLTGGYAEDGGAVYNLGTLTIEGGTIRANYSQDTDRGGSGAAVYNAGTLVMTGGIIEDNIGDDCGAVFNAAAGTLDLTDAVIKGNRSFWHGGGAIVNYGTAVLKDCTLTGNNAKTNGGGIWNNGSLTLVGCTLGANASEDCGGGIYNTENGTLDLTDTVIKDNTISLVNAAHRGGGIYNGGTLTMNGGTVSGNKGDDAGGIFNAAGKTAVLNGVTIDHNESVNHGGGGIVSYGILEVTGCTVENNKAKGGGAGIWSNHTLTLTDSIIRNNTSQSSGGGICLALNSEDPSRISEALVTDCTMTGNSAAEGGGIFLVRKDTGYGVKLTLSGNNTISGNNSSAQGGGISSGGWLALQGHCEITGNTAGTYGGGIWHGGHVLSLSDTVIIKENTGSEGADDLYLPLGQLIGIPEHGMISNDSEIYVSAEEKTCLILAGANANSGVFRSDDPDYAVVQTAEGLSLSAAGGYYVSRYESGGTVVSESLLLAEALPLAEVLENGRWYYVSEDTVFAERILVNDGVNANIVIADGVTLDCLKGIFVSREGELHIYGQIEDSGILNAYGEDCQAGIGGNDETRIGTIMIHGGTVNAYGGARGSGIGTGYLSYPVGRIVILGGNVTAIGGTDAAGIGSGSETGNCEITIYGGKVIARGGRHGSGIGSGYGASQGANIRISGGEITAQAGEGASGIGTGAGSMNVSPAGGIVYITGGTVTASGNGPGAAIGGSLSDNGGIIHLDGGTVYLSSSAEGVLARCELLLLDKGMHVVEETVYGEVKQVLYPDRETKVLGSGKDIVKLEISPCTHEHSAYTVDENGMHQMHCQECRTEFAKEAHTGEQPCGICGYDGSTAAVSFAPGGGSGRMDSTMVVPGGEYILPECTFYPPYVNNYSREFCFWQVSSGDDTSYHSPGEMIMVTGDTVITAVWETRSFTVTFDTDGGTPVDSMSFEYGSVVTMPWPDPEKDGCRFVEWRQVLDDSGTLADEAYEFGTQLVFGDLILKAVWEDLVPVFKSQSLTLSGKIGVNFYLDLSMLSEEEREKAEMVFTVMGSTERETETTVRYDPEFKNSTGEYYGFTCYVNSIQMAEEIEAELIYKQDDRWNIIRKKYSVKEYLQVFEANKDRFDEKTVRLVRATADYGHYVQPFLSAARGWKIGEDYAEMDVKYTVYSNDDIDMIKHDLQRYAVVKDDQDPDIAKITYSLMLDSGTDIQVYVRPAEGYTGPVTVTVDGRSAEAQLREDGRYMVKISDISAHLLGKTHTVNITTAGGSAQIKLSALSYVRTMLETYADRNAREAAAAIFSYYEAADLYVND